MAGKLTTSSIEALLQHLFAIAPFAEPTALYLASHSGTPATSANEIAITRVNVTTAWDYDFINEWVYNLNTIIIQNTSGSNQTIVSVSIWDSSGFNAGTMYAWGDLSPSVTLTPGATEFLPSPNVTCQIT